MRVKIKQFIQVSIQKVSSFTKGVGLLIMLCFAKGCPESAKDT